MVAMRARLCTVSFSPFSITRVGFSFCFHLGFEMGTSLPFRGHISKMKESASSIIKVSAIFVLIFHKIHFWKGTPQPFASIPQPTRSRHLTDIFL
jgi:hypothetical protein